MVSDEMRAPFSRSEPPLFRSIVLLFFVAGAVGSLLLGDCLGLFWNCRVEGLWDLGFFLCLWVSFGFLISRVSERLARVFCMLVSVSVFVVVRVCV